MSLADRRIDSEAGAIQTSIHSQNSNLDDSRVLEHIEHKTKTGKAPTFEKILAISALLKSRMRHGLLFTSTTISGLLIMTNLHPQPSLLLLSAFASMLSTLSVYLMNDFVDIKIDKINAPNRPLASGIVKKPEALSLILALTLGSIGIAFLTSILTVILVSAYLIIGILYSAPKISLQNRFLVKTALVAAGAFLTTLIGASSSGTIEIQSLAVSFTFMSFMFVTSPINDLADYVGDKKHGKRTIPVVIGQKKTVLFTIILPFFITVIFWIFYHSWNFSVATPIALTILPVVAFKVLYPIYKNSNDYKYVRKRHKKSLLLHYGLQLGLIVGTITFI